MTTVNSLSGGKTSSYLSVHYPADHEIFSLVCINDPNCRPKDPAVIKYVNYKLESYATEYGEFVSTAEDDRTLTVMMDLEQFLGRRITWVRGQSFDNIIDEEKWTRLPSWARRYCTDQMKVLPIFNWWFNNIGEKVQMRIGFRFDEYIRAENFMNNSNHNFYTIPVSCSLKGERRQKHESFEYRTCHFPLIRDGVTKHHINDFWRIKGYVGVHDLFGNAPRRIEFPAVSNCVGCFHKKAETLAAMWSMHPDKMNWFSLQEEKGKGTWLDSKLLYKSIQMSSGWTEEMIKENGSSCDSGGCTD